MRRSTEAYNDLFSVESWGAVGGLVTGSLHKLKHRESTVVIDAGIHQGKNDMYLPDGRSRNSQDLGNLKKVSDILVTHAHADHVGRIPLFYKNNFHPRLLTTLMTSELMEIILNDSLKIQKGGEKLYGRGEVDKSFQNLSEISFGKRIDIGNRHDNLTALWTYNGHIPGSASIIIEKKGKRGGIFFSGDVGQEIQPICGGWGEIREDLSREIPIKAMWIESTNFDREAFSFQEKYEQFINTINETLKKEASVAIAAISMQRNQEVLELLARAQERGDISKEVPIFKDAPLANKFEETYIEDAELFMTRRFGDNHEFYKSVEKSKNRFELKNSRVIEDNKQSREVAEMLALGGRPSIIVTSGGMLGFGRVRNYIDGNFGRNPKNTIILTCYQVEGTEGRLLSEQGNIVRGDKAGAKVVHLEVFTGHVSGEGDTFKYLERFDLSELGLIAIIHGNNKNRIKMAEAFKSRGYGARVILPEIGEKIPFTLEGGLISSQIGESEEES